MRFDRYDYDPADDTPRRSGRCQCFAPGEAAGTCPGPADCPMCNDEDDEEDDGDEG